MQSTNDAEGVEDAHSVRVDHSLGEDQLTLFILLQDEGEHVTLLCNSKGELYANSQVQDYIFRGPEMERCSYLAFITDTWEERSSTSSNTTAHAAPSAESGSRRAGRPRHVRSQYTEGHPKRDTHRRVFRSQKHNTLPHIAGPWFPRRDNTAVYHFYCACMLALLKPWRTSNDLKNGNISWADALEQFVANSPPIIRRILAGVQYYYDSKAACDFSSENNESQTTTISRRQEIFDDAMDGTFDAGEETSAGCVITEQDLKMFKRSQLSPREEAHANEAINVALSHGMFPMTLPSNAGNRISYHLAAGQDRLRLAHWQAAMKSMAASIHSPPHLQDDTQNDLTSVCALNSILDEEDEGDATLVSDLGVRGDRLDAAAPHELLEEQ